MSHKAPPLLGIAAYSGTGKTTLLKSLIPLLQQRQVHVNHQLLVRFCLEMSCSFDLPLQFKLNNDRYHNGHYS